MKTHSKHILAYCSHCQVNMVRCATCQNNSCNAGYGLVDGKTCPDCPEAHKHADMYHDDEKSVIFSKIE